MVRRRVRTGHLQQVFQKGRTKTLGDMISTSIPSYERGKPVLYEIKVDLGSNTKPYVVKRRYNDFLKLASDVEAEMGEPVTVAPPQKPSIWQSVDYEQRRLDLEIMLTALVRIPEFAECLAVGNFLEVYKHRNAVRSTSQTVDWISTTSEISRLISEARSQSQTSHIRQRTLQAKLLAGQLQQTIDKGAEQLGTGEKARRQQQLDSYLLAIRNLEAKTDGTIEMQETKPTTESRVLGETSETRKLNNQGLLQTQEQNMRDQDEMVEELRAAVARQKELGLAIHGEIVKQNELLDELDTDVHRVNARLNEARRKTNKLKR